MFESRKYLKQRNSQLEEENRRLRESLEEVQRTLSEKLNCGISGKPADVAFFGWLTRDYGYCEDDTDGFWQVHPSIKPERTTGNDPDWWSSDGWSFELNPDVLVGGTESLNRLKFSDEPKKVLVQITEIKE